jgi:hypothetical protein
MVTMIFVSASSRSHQQMMAEESILKTMSDGFAFVETEPSPHQHRTCHCEHRSVCPLTMRNSNDSMCSFMHVLTINEHVGINQGILRIPTVTPRLPNVIWCRADKRGIGYAFHMTIDRISKISRDKI